MNEDFLSYYRSNLTQLRHRSAEFAAQFPKIASKLNLSSVESQDPFVERLLEGAAFLAARVEKKFDDGYPEFLQQILMKVCPLATTPLPAASVVSFYNTEYAYSAEAIDFGFTFDVKIGKSLETTVRFSPFWSSHIYPLYVSDCQYESSLVNVLPTYEIEKYSLKSALSISIGGCDKIKSTDIGDADSIDLFTAGSDSFSSRLSENLINHLKVVYEVDEDGSVRRLSNKISFEYKINDANNIFNDILRSMPGISTMQLYFAYPFLFHFLKVNGLLDYISSCEKKNVRLIFGFSNIDSVVASIGQDSLKFGCVPVINLFKKRSSRNRISVKHDFLVSPDRTDSLDYEVFNIDEVELYDGHNTLRNRALPFYSFRNSIINEDDAIFFSSVRRDRMRGLYKARTNYKKTDMFVSLSGAIYSSGLKDLQEFTALTWCTNADLPLFILPSQKLSSLDGNVEIPFIIPITKPQASLFMHGNTDSFARLSMIIMNFSALLLQDSEAITATLQNLLQTFCLGSVDEKKVLIEAISSVQSRQTVFRFVKHGYIYYEKGFEVDIVLDEKNLAGFGVFSFGSMLKRVLDDFTPLNILVKVSLYGVKAGLIRSWNQNVE